MSSASGFSGTCPSKFARSLAKGKNQMNRRIMDIGVAICVAWLSACAPMMNGSPKYPVSEAGAVTSVSQFDERLTSHSGTEIRVAGRIQRIDTTPDGYDVLASWLPYPTEFRLGGAPMDASSDQVRHFVFHFHGKPKSPFTTWRGNKFMLEGRVEGTRHTVVDMFGTRKALLYVRADCVRVWETGGDTVNRDPDAAYPDAMAHTFCARKSS